MVVVLYLLLYFHIFTSFIFVQVVGVSSSAEASMPETKTVAEKRRATKKTVLGPDPGFKPSHEPQIEDRSPYPIRRTDDVARSRAAREESGEEYGEGNRDRLATLGAQAQE